MTHIRPARLAAALLCSLLFLVAPGCHSSAIAPDGTRARESKAPELSAGSVLLGVPPAPDEAGGSCGRDCLIQILGYHGQLLDDEGQRKFPADGTKPEVTAGELKEYLVARGFRAHLIHGKLDDSRPAGLEYVLSLGLPVIVGREIKGKNHFDIVCGYDPEHRWVLIAAPFGIGALPYARFEETWAKLDHLMIVAAPEDKIEEERPPIEEQKPPIEHASATTPRR